MTNEIVENNTKVSSNIRKYSSFPATFDAVTFDNFFLEIEQSLKERSKIKNQDGAKVMLLMLSLDELKKNKFHLDTLREDARLNKKTVDFSGHTAKLMKSVSFIYEALIEQDSIDIDKKSLSKVAHYLIKVVESILVDRFNFTDSDLNKFHTNLKTKAPDIDNFVTSIIKQQ